MVLTLAQYLRPDCPVDLPLVVLCDHAEYAPRSSLTTVPMQVKRIT